MIRRNLLAVIGLLSGILLVNCAAPQATTPEPASPPTAASASTSPAAPAATPKPATTTAPATSAEQPVYGGTFSLSLRDDPPSFDIHQESSAPSVYFVANATYNTLLTYDNLDHNKMVPDLARKWEVSPDGLSYTFYLNEGVKWHDGTPFTAEDVKFSLMREKDPPKGVFSVSQFMFKPMESVEVVDPHTVKMRMSRPLASFPLMMSLGGNAILPKHILEKQLDMKRDVIGTGPWKLKKYTRGVSIELDKNPDYFKKGLPYMDKTVAYIMLDATARLAVFRVGRVLTDQRDHEPPGIDTIEQTMKDVAIAYRIPGVMNTRNPFIVQDRPPFNNVRLRQAVGLALDRWEFVRLCQPGMYTPGGYMVPGGSWALADQELYSQPGYAKSGPAKDAEREQAKKLLADAGYPNGLDTEIEFRIGVEGECQATWLKSEIEKIGVRSTIRSLEGATYTDHLQKRTFQIMASAYSYTVDDPDLMFGEAYAKDGGKNWGRYNNPEFDKLLDEQSVAVDPAKRKDIVHQMQLILHQTVPFPILGWKNRTVGVWKKVKGYTPWTSDGRQSSAYRYEYTWLDPNLPPK